MKANQIHVGSLYRAKVSGRVVTVRVDAIRDQTRWSTRASYTGYRATETRLVYDVTNLSTGRRCTFRSAAKFRSAVSQAAPPLPAREGQ